MTSDLEKLRATQEEFCRFIEGLPEAKLVEQDWGPKEVLAHLVCHHESYVAQVEAFLARTPFEPPQGRFSDLNAQAVAASRGVPISELISRLRAATERLSGLYQARDPNTIVLEIKRGATPRTLGALVPEVEAHIRNHHRRLGKSLSKGVSRPKAKALRN